MPASISPVLSRVLRHALHEAWRAGPPLSPVSFAFWLIALLLVACIFGVTIGWRGSRTLQVAGSCIVLANAAAVCVAMVHLDHIHSQAAGVAPFARFLPLCMYLFPWAVVFHLYSAVCPWLVLEVHVPSAGRRRLVVMFGLVSAVGNAGVAAAVMATYHAGTDTLWVTWAEILGYVFTMGLGALLALLVIVTFATVYGKCRRPVHATPAPPGPSA